MKRHPFPRLSHRIAQPFDLSHQQIAAPVEQVDRKEIGPARNPVAAIM